MKRIFAGALRVAGAAALCGIALASAVARGAPPRTVIVRLEGNQFQPAVVRARPGDTIRFVNGNGGPHNVAFERDSMPAAGRALLEKAMGGEKLGPLSGPLLLDPGESYVIVIPALAAGRYPLFCAPHIANMRGALQVVP